MKLGRLLLPLGLMAGAIAFGAIQTSAQEGGPPPTSGKVIASGLQGTIGAAIGPDGALYVVEGGTGGSKKVTTPDGDGFFGLTGRVSRIDPVTGARTTFASGLPSGAESEGGDGFSAADVVFLDGELYYLLSGGFNYIAGLEAYPNGVYKIEKDGSSKLVANLSKFNDDNPVAFPDAGPGGNPFGITVRAGEFYVTDGNYNRVLHITVDGKINILTSFDNVVSTGIIAKNTGPLIITEFGASPFDPSSGKVIQVGVPTGTQVELAGGFSQIISVAYGPGGKLYALSMGDQGDPAAGEGGAVPFTGKILRVNADGTLTPIVDGLMLGTSLDITGDTAYVTSLIGEVYRIDGLSTIAPLPVAPPEPTAPAAVPTATPRSGNIAPPNTGSGPGAADTTAVWALVLAAALMGTVALGAGVRTSRR